MFCVMTVVFTWEASAATAWCPAFAWARAIGSTKWSTNSATDRGAARAVCNRPFQLANFSGGNRCQKPPASRNVGIPLSAEMPAPVKTTTRLACRRAKTAVIQLSVFILRSLDSFFRECMNCRSFLRRLVKFYSTGEQKTADVSPDTSAVRKSPRVRQWHLKQQVRIVLTEEVGRETPVPLF